MKIFKKIFDRKNKIESTQTENTDLNTASESSTESFNKSPKKVKVDEINLDTVIEIKISSSPVGQLTNSSEKDFYVYEWFIKDTGEIFYVGKGRGNRYKEFQERPYEAEKIRKLYDTDVKFVKTNLTEKQAIELESAEMIRILNETTDRLTNRNKKR